jgi:cytochrome c-type biogenesis protein CcmH
MMAFTGAAALMVAAALGFLLPPLLRGRVKASGASGSDANVDVYRHQVRELEADREAGIVSPSAYDESRLELERRMVDDLASSSTGGRAPSAKSGRMAAIAIAVALPLLAAALYWKFGTPAAIDAPPAPPAASPHGQGHSTTPEQIDAMVEKLATRLAKEGKGGKDGEGWAMLARSYVALGRHPEAVPAYERAVALLPRDAQLLADYADALAVTLKGRIEGKPMKLLQQALRLDPKNMKALALVGTAAFDRKDYAGAADLWQRAVDAAPPGEEFTASLQASIAEARALAGGKVPPLAAPVAIAPAASAGSAAATASAATVSGQVTLAPELAKRVSPDDSLLLFARAAEGPRMPLALLKRRVGDLPLEFVLDDGSAMMPTMKLSSVDRVVIVARISKTASAQAQSGDLEGSVGPVAVGSAALRIRIDRVVP